MSGGTIDFGSARQNGAWLVGEPDLAALEHAARADGLAVQRIDLTGCRDKGELLRRIAATLDFPATFGGNWDALADCLADLSWRPDATGHVWLFEHAVELQQSSRGDFDTLCEVLEGACQRWGARGTRCFAFLAMPGDALDR